MVLGEESASIPLTPSIAGGSVPVGTSWRGGSAAIGAGGEPSLALTSVGSDSPTRGEPLLQWVSPEDLTSMGSDSPAWSEPLLWWVSLEDLMLMLFTLNDATESMERESLDVGVMSMLEALHHARGALRDVVIPVGRIFA